MLQDLEAGKRLELAPIVGALIEPVVAFFGQVQYGEFFSSTGDFAVLPLVSGTLMVTVIALAVAVPLGLGAAMYLSEYASERARKALKPTVELLAGVPSVVYGFFALAFVTPTLLQKLLSIDRIRQFGWAPSITLEEGVRLAYRYYSDTCSVSHAA